MTQQTVSITYEQLEEAVLDYLHITGNLPILEGPVSLDIPMALDTNGLITIGLDVITAEDAPILPPYETKDVTDEEYVEGLHRYLGAEVLTFPSNA